ncbi:xylulokinase [Leucobacter ruminantium]|uniref:Xylulokinase n=1 Tax=Leucobacter ruminantium TaxID=1289170 RepID=A0A939RZ28_9MICO|nr:FGGY family carbohydrate kinase [Leucobacter ruminantium]MBO1806303.1 hypothetical protein [Leucobacter ruminantium]
MEVVIAVDSSTTASKAVAFSLDGAVRAIGRAPISLSAPRTGWREQDPTEWWSTTAAALREVSTRLRERGDETLAVGITHQRESFACLDEENDPVRPAILWLDGRPGEQVRSLGTPEVHDLSGKPPSTTPSFYKLAWLAENEPEALDRTARIADVHAYLSLAMTGRFATSSASADPTGLVDHRSGRWSERLLELASVRIEQLPEIVSPGSPIGGLLPETAELTGLPVGLPIIAGGGDGQCAGLGSGIVAPGQAYLSLGTSIALGTHSERVDPSPSYRVMASPLGHGHTLDAFIASGSYSVSWFRKSFALPADDTAGHRDEDPFELAVERSEGRMQSLMFVPHLSGGATPYWDDRMRGAFVGISDDHTAAEFYRAVLEGLAFEIRLLCDGFEHAGSPIEGIAVTGGGTASDRWLQIISDVTGRPLELACTTEATALGAAILAAAATRFDGDIEAAAAAMTRPERRVEPHPDRAERYAEIFPLYATVAPALASFDSGAAALGLTS